MCGLKILSMVVGVAVGLAMQNPREIFRGQALADVGVFMNAARCFANHVMECVLQCVHDVSTIVLLNTAIS